MSPEEFQTNEANHTITVNVMPHEALWAASMFHYIGDEDPNDVTHWPIAEITISGEDGGMTFTGQQTRKSFKYASMLLYTLTYK